MSSPYETAKTVLTVCTIIVSVVLRFGPAPDFWWVIKHKTTGQVQLLPVVAMGTNSAFLLLYGVTLRDYLPLVVTSLFSVTMAVVFSVIFHHYTPNRRPVYRLWAASLALVIALTAYTVLALAGITRQSRSQVSDILGWITVVSTAFLYVAPLATIKHVLQTKNAASIPFSFCLLSTINAALWVAYSALVSEWLVFGPNLLGVPLGVVQIALWVIYRPTSLKTLPTSGSICDSVVVDVVRTRSGLERIPSRATSGDDFAEVITPRTQSPLVQ